MINFDKIKTFPVIGDPDPRIISMLINMEDESQRFEFLWNPIDYSYSASNTYITQYAMFGMNPNTKFMSAQVGKLTIDNLTFFTPCHDRSLNKIRGELESLRRPKVIQVEPAIEAPIVIPTPLPVLPTVSPVVEVPPVIVPTTPLTTSIPPPILSWVTGQNVIQPLYMESISWQRLDQQNGYDTALSLSITFIGQNQIQF